MDERNYYLCFSLAPNIGPKRFKQLLSHFKTAENAWKRNSGEYLESGISNLLFEKFDKFRKRFNVEGYLKLLHKKGVQFITFAEENYPKSLKEIENPPIVLFVRGDVSSLNCDKTIAVVGTRKITSYGEEVTEKLVSELVLQGFTIVSGLALGVDAMAHKTALENNGKTIAVLGCGADCCFPVENQFLYNKIIESGGVVVSEYPLSVPPSRGTFPARNRIISGVSSGVLVTEAGEDSGSLITASNAASQGKPVFAVPGPITSQMSKGTIKLLKNNAVLVQSANDILDTFGMEEKEKNIDIEGLDLTPDERKIVEVLQNEKMDIDRICRKTNIKISVLNIILTELELKGIVKNYGGEFGLKS